MMMIKEIAMLQRVTSRKKGLPGFEFMLAEDWHTLPPRQSLQKPAVIMLAIPRESTTG
jgi:hypothetical protein